MLPLCSKPPDSPRSLPPAAGDELDVLVQVQAGRRAGPQREHLKALRTQRFRGNI